MNLCPLVTFDKLFRSNPNGLFVFHRMINFAHLTVTSGTQFWEIVRDTLSSPPQVQVPPHFFLFHRSCPSRSVSV